MCNFGEVHPIICFCLIPLDPWSSVPIKLFFVEEAADDAEQDSKPEDTADDDNTVAVEIKHSEKEKDNTEPTSDSIATEKGNFIAYRKFILQLC